MADKPAEEATTNRKGDDHVQVTVAFPFSHVRIATPFARGSGARELAEIVASLADEIAELAEIGGSAERRERVVALADRARELAGTE